MATSPQQFAKLLKGSTFSPAEQRALLELLPQFSPAQIQEFALVLQNDTDSQKNTFDDFKKKANALADDFSTQISLLEGGAAS